MKLFLTLVFISATLFSTAQKHTTDLKLLQEFQDMKFGMFVHWGPVSLKGTEIGWSRGREVAEEEYDQLYKQFNPELFNADEWIKTLKNAGMKYFVITTRHHDGFSIWPTQYSDYDISATPYKKDILLELKEACEKYDILFGTYYSICDWKHPDYPLGSPGGKSTKDAAKMDKFIPFIENQTKELIEKYNSKILWFDGEWEEPWTHEMGLDLYDYLKELNANILINNRVDKGRKGMEGITISKEFAGDFATPEQRVGTYNIENPWESCITICQQWAWKPNDKMKSLDECLQTLIRTVAGGGNLLFNVGPMPDGRIEPRQVERLKEIGQWLKTNGESIYSTRGGPYKPNKLIASTRKNNTIYLHLLNIRKNNITIPFPENVEITACSDIHGEKVEFSKTDQTVRVFIPKSMKGTISVIKLTIDGNAGNLKTMEIL